MINPSGFLEADTAEDAIFSLDVARHALGLVAQNDQWWKWAVLATHSAVQGGLALALEGGSGFLVQKPGKMKEILAAHDQGLALPEPHMDNFLRLFQRAQAAGSLRSGILTFTSEEQDAVQRLDNLRDEFVHFNCKSWLVEYKFMAECLLGCCSVLEKIVDCEAIIWHDEGHQGRASSAIAEIRTVALRHAS